VPDYAGFCAYTPIDPTTAKAYEDGIEDPGDTEQLDFSSGFEKSLWN